MLLEETVLAVQPKPHGRYVDCTLGGAGHSERLLELSSPSGKLLALDQDEWAIAHAQNRLAAYGERFSAVRVNFREVEHAVREQHFDPVDGVLFDLGVSSPQFDEAGRGFSYRFDAPLDMRMDVRQQVTAKDLVNTAAEGDLVRIFFEYGEEKFSRRVARAIVEHRSKSSIESTGELADIVKEAIPAAARRTGPHPARKVFQALRIAVNDELGALQEALTGAFAILKPGGRIAVISFHSLEDRIVKRQFQEWATGCICPPDFPVCMCHREPEAAVITKKPLLPGSAEIEENSRARSAKLRVVEKL